MNHTKECLEAEAKLAKAWAKRSITYTYLAEAYDKMVEAQAEAKVKRDAAYDKLAEAEAELEEAHLKCKGAKGRRMGKIERTQVGALLTIVSGIFLIA